MIALIAALGLAAQTTPPAEPAWTWTLYSDAGPVVLANEAPDTPNLRATLECDPGSSIARVTLYGGESLAGMARISAGEASAVAQAEAGRAGAMKVAVRTDHPVFAAFGADGRMTVVVGDQRRAVEVPQAHLAKLRRFAELCSG
jgi:hypothetical protein